MSLYVTRAQMRTRALQRANMESSGLVTAAEVNDLINVAICEFWDELTLDGACREYFATDYAITTVSGTIAYALPADFRSLIGVFANDSTTRLREIVEMRPGTLAAYDAPTGGYATTLRYCPTPPQLTTDNADATGQIDDVSGWSQLIIKAVARDLLAKEESDTSQVERELAQVRARVLRHATNRVAGGPRFITDVEGLSRWPLWATQSVDAWTLLGGNLNLYQLNPTYP